MLTGVGENLWTADGPVVTAALGFRYPTRMAVLRLGDGGLALWSPIAPSPELQAAVMALGPVRFLMAPNTLHHVFIGDWQRAFPEAHLLASPGLAKKRSDLRIDAELGDAKVAAWAGEINHVVLHTTLTVEAVFFHRASSTVLFTDLIQQLPKGWYSGWRALVARLDLMTAAEPSVPRKFRLAFKDRRAARASVQRILAWPAQTLIMAHGPIVTANAAAAIARAFQWLKA